MIHQRDDIVADVRRAMEMNAHETPLIADDDTLDLEAVITDRAPVALRQLLSMPDMRPSKLESGHSLRPKIDWEDNPPSGCRCLRGRFLLPDDFMRLVVFQMDDWDRPVTSLVKQTDAEYTLLRSPFRGLGGTPQRPVCALVRSSEGLWLEFYSCKSQQAKAIRATYIRYPKWDRDGGLDVPDPLYDAFVLMTAALTCLTYSEGDKGKMLMELAKAAI